MSRPPSPITESTVNEAMDTEESSHVEPAEELSDQPPKTKTKKPKAPETLTREAGKSLLPHARVQKILKADKVRCTNKTQR